ncbi:hypothetical protein QJQ45_029224, partial [Haematococcus lacustris]
MQAIGSMQPHRNRDQVERKEQKGGGAPRTRNKINMAQLRGQSRARSQEVQPLEADGIERAESYRMSFESPTPSCNTRGQTTAMTVDPPAGGKPPELEGFGLTKDSQLDSALTGYAIGSLLLPRNHPTSAGVRALYTLPSGKPRPAAPLPRGPRTADPNLNNVTEEDANIIIASIANAGPDGAVFSTFTPALRLGTAITIRDIYLTEDNKNSKRTPHVATHTGRIGHVHMTETHHIMQLPVVPTLTTAYDKMQDQCLCHAEVMKELKQFIRTTLQTKRVTISVDERKGDLASFDVTITINPEEAHSSLAFIGLVGAVIASKGPLSYMQCVQGPFQGRPASVVIARPLLSIAIPPCHPVRMSVQYHSRMTEGSPAAKAPSSISARGYRASSLRGDVQYAISKALEVSVGQEHAQNTAFLLCSSIVSIKDVDAYLDIGFAEASISSAIQQLERIKIDATDSLSFSLATASSSQATGLLTRDGMSLSLSCAAMQPQALATSIQKLAIAYHNKWGKDLQLTALGGGDPVNAASVTASGALDVHRYVGIFSGSKIRALTGVQLPQIGSGTKQLLIFVPGSLAQQAALTFVMAEAGSTNKPVLDSTGTHMTVDGHAPSHMGPGKPVGYPTSAAHLIYQQLSTAASTAMSAAHRVAGTEAAPKIGSIMKTMSPLAAHHLQVGKAAHATQEEADPTPLQKVLDTVPPLITAMLSYYSQPGGREAAKATIKAHLDTMAAHIAEGTALATATLPPPGKGKPGPPPRAAAKEEPSTTAGGALAEEASTSGAAMDPPPYHDGTLAASSSLCKIAHRFHLSTHGVNNGRTYTVYQFNSTLHVYYCYQTTKGETNWTNGTLNPIAAARDVYVAWLLLAAGDVEANPGPAIKHFQQDQDSSACQIYSLNNAAGHEWVTMHDIDSFYENRLPQLTDNLERGAWLMARGIDGYSDEVIEMYLRTHYGLAVQSIAQLNQPSDWSADNLGNLAGQYGTHTFLCRKQGHSMAMKCMNGTWNLLDSMETAPTPLLRISTATKRTMHQVFVITPNTRSREQIRQCKKKGIHHIISHAEQTPIATNPTYISTHNPTHMYMEGQYEECCLVHAFNMAMGKKYIDYHAVIDHCKQLQEHLQSLAQKAREEGYAIRTFTTDHIYHEKGKFSTDTLNHYLYRKQHEICTYLHPATTYLPTHSITPETITTTIASTGATTTDAVLLLSHHHATVIKHTHQGWYQLDSLNRMPKPLSTPNDWKHLQGNLLTICTGNVKNTRYIRREIWIADPLEATTASALAAHFQDHTDPIDLTTNHTETGEIPAAPPATTNSADDTHNLDTNRRTTIEATHHEEPARARQRRDTPTVTLPSHTAKGKPRNNRPTTTPANATGPTNKRARATTARQSDTHTQTLMCKYLRTPTAEVHTTRPVPTADEAPKTTPNNTSQHHTPSPPPTHNRQHITLTTFNVRGLHRSRNEVLNLVHSRSPDILILTETMTQPRSNNPSFGWLKRVMPNYSVHRHQGHSEVLIGIRHDLAIQMQATMMQPCTDADVNTRCVILSLRQRQSEELTLVATYWPSGNNDDAIPLRRKMQEHIRTTTGHLPGSLILAGDINATMKTEDRSEHTEYTQDTMMREFATEMRLSEADSGDRAWTYQQPHCNSRIDAILTRDARHGPEHRTHVDTNAYLSDHRPLTATLNTARLGIDLAAPHKPPKHSHTILTTPITNKDREAYRLAVQQPSSGAPQLHAHLTAYLAPMYTDAIHFLATIDKANPQQPQRLTLVAGLPAREAIDTAATMLTTLLQTCRTTAIKTCNTKTLTRGGQHYQRRTMCRIRQALGKKLKTTRELSRKARVFFKQNNVHPTIDELIPETDTTNAETREAVQARQGDDTTENHVQAALAQLTNSYRDQIHKLDDDDSALAIAQARIRMQQLISTQPKKANKYILRPSRTDHKGLQALADPITNKIHTAPADLNRIITEAYGTKLAPPTPKTGNYTNTQTRNYPWARAKADDPFTMHTCQNVHWLHTAIMDKAGFQECLSRLSGGKAPGPDGIENEIIKMLPWEMRDTIHQLFITMWATGCTPTTWKTSDTCLLYKDKGQETDLNSYRPVGLANTVYKLWTSLITKILSEYAEANGMLSKNQAGFRSHRNTTQQLQMLVMALEDAKLAKADIYALLVDFTSAFNTTCQDKLLWIMHDLGFPTDATDAVKDLYTGATTRFRTPYGPTDPVPVDRGTIQGDSLSPFLFLIYIEPLLRWLQVGARGYKFKSATADSGERATVSSIDYADDIAILCNTLRNLRCQADKLSAFSDWGHLIISHSKTLATAALHHSIETGMCSNAAEADKWARQQLQTVSLQGKPVTYHRPTSPFTYLGVLITMTLDWKPQHTAMITQLRHKLERLRRSFASARQAIHIIRTAIIPSLAYSFCAVPCTPGDLELYDRSINQCVKLKLRLPLGTPNAIVREDAGKLGMGISSTAQEYHARNTTALTHSLQSTDVTHAHISRSMLHKQITWLNTQANTQGHRMLTLFHHTLRARQLVYTSLAGLSATEGGLPLYPKECQTLGRLITQASSSNAHDVVSASITCLKSLGITHASELSCEGNTHIITGSMLTSKYGKKVKQKHIIALNKLAAMAAQPSCPDATATRAIRDSRNTSLDLPPNQRKITTWAAGLTELAPTPAVPDTRIRYMDMKAYAVMHATQPATADRAAAAPAVHDATRTSSRLLKREQRATQPPPTKPTLPKAGTKRNNEGRQTQSIPQDIVRIVGLDLPGLSSWKVDKACRCKPKNLGCILGAMYGHQEAITSIDGWQWDGINKENYYKVHWKPTVIDRWALPLCAEEGYTPTHIETISREEAKDVCTCELCWLPRGDSPTCHNCKRAYHPACLEEAHLSGHKEPGYWLCPICKFGSNDFKTTMRQSAHSDLIRVHWHPTLEPAPLITAHLDYIAKRNDYDEENRQIQEARHARPDTHLPAHTRQGLPDPHTWLPRCTNLHSKATFHTYPINPQTDIVGTGNCETLLQLHPHMTDPAMSLSTGEPIMPRHDLVQHVTVHDESGRTVGLLTKDQHQHLHAWLQHTPHTRNLATEVVALLRRQDAQSSHNPMRGAQDNALNTLHATRSFPSTVQRWADPLTVRPETTTYWSPDINDTAFGAHHNCLLVRHTGLSTWNVPADDAVALKCVNHAIHSATQEEAMATIMLIPGKKGISYPKHIDTLRRYPEYCQHLASIPPTKTRCSKPGKHANLHIYVIWNAAGQQLVTKGNPQGWLASTATALHPQRDTHPIRNRPTNQSQPATPPSGHKQHMRLPLDKDLPTSGHQRGHQQLTHHSTTQPRMAITEWATLAYTDGSCIKTSGAAPASVGAGVYIPETNVLITVTLDDPESNTINRAELTAIHAALTAGAKRIATDSLCSIYQIHRALANPMSLITHRHNDILTAIATLIIDSPVTIHFYKVRAHSGIIGNEGADALAKHAALHPELANTPAYRPTTRKETNTWLSNEADGEFPAPLPDCRQSVRAHMHRKHSLGLANQDSVYYQMSQEITKAAAKGAGERVMTDTNISIPAQRTALLYRTGGLYNQKLAMRWKRATDDRCPLCGEADSATHLLSGCSETLPMVQERHNGAGRLIAKAISKGTLGGYISFADTGSWEKGAKEDLDLPNDTLHTTLRALGLKTAATKNTTRPDILMVTPTTKTGKRVKAIKRVIIIEIKYCSDS